MHVIKTKEYELLTQNGSCVAEVINIRNYIADPFGDIPVISCNSTCIKNLTFVFSNIERLKCEMNDDIKYISTSLDRHATTFLCDSGITGDSCVKVLQSYKRSIQSKSLNCQSLQDFPCCSNSIGKFFQNISNSLLKTSSKIVTHTTGIAFFQKAVEKEIYFSNTSLAIEYYSFLQSSCPSYNDNRYCLNTAYTYEPSNSTEILTDTCITAVESYCKCQNPFDMGCSRYDFSKIWIIHQMEVL